MTTYLVTGGAGFIGSHVVDRLLAIPEARVVVSDDLTTGSLNNLEHHKNNPRLEVHTSDPRGIPYPIERLASSADVIFHLAAAAGVKRIADNPYASLTANTQLTSRLISSCFGHKPHIIFTSSSEVYGPHCPTASEDAVSLGSSTNMRWGYAAEKFFAECQLAAAWNNGAGTPYTAFRLFNIVGTRQSPTNNAVLPKFIRAVLERKPIEIYGRGEQRRAFCHVDDLIDAFMLALEKPLASSGRVFNVGSHASVSMLELACLVADVGITRGFKPLNPIYKPFESIYGKNFAEVETRSPNTYAIRAVMGWQPQHDSLRNIITELFDYELALRSPSL